MLAFVALLLATWALPAAAQVEMDAMSEAKAALGSTPPDREAARRALERAATDGGAPVDLAEAYFRLGFLDEEDGAFERALANQRACIAKAPYSTWARSARQRIRWISARSEGAFEPLARLQRVRRNPALGNDPAAIEELSRDADAFPRGRVRAEARMFVAEGWLIRLDRPVDAILEFRKVADDSSSDSTDAALAHRGLLQVLLALGRLDDAASEVRSFPASDPELSDQVHRLVLHRALRRAAVAGIVMLALGLAVGLVVASLRRHAARLAVLGTRASNPGTPSAER